MRRTDNGYEFLKETFQNALKREGIDFSACRNPDVKCAIVERAHRTICDSIQKYLSHYSTFRFIHDLLKFVTAYSDTVHTIRDWDQHE
jgi:hypothetical protein